MREARPQLELNLAKYIKDKKDVCKYINKKRKGRIILTNY